MVCYSKSINCMFLFKNFNNINANLLLISKILSGNKAFECLQQCLEFIQIFNTIIYFNLRIFSLILHVI